MEDLPPEHDGKAEPRPQAANADPERPPADAPRPIGGRGVVVRPPGPIRAQSTSLKVHNVQAISAGPEQRNG
jgi:hypothetical protein